MEISAKVKRGNNAGSPLYPHLHADGMYVVSKSRFECDYIRLANLHEVATYIKDVYSVRMSNPNKGVLAASLISPDSISVTL